MQTIHRSLPVVPLLLFLTPVAVSAQGSTDQPRLEAFDVGTPGSGGELRFRAEALPNVGQPWSTRVLCGPPGAHACLLANFDEVPLLLPQFGGTWYVGFPAMVVPFDFDGEGISPELLMWSTAPASLLGVPFVAQAFLFDPVSQGGVTLSNPLRVTFGDTVVAPPSFLYVNNNDSGSAGNSVSAFAVAADGTVSALPGSPFATGGSSISSAGPWDILAATPDREHLFAVNRASLDVTSFLVQADGALVSAPGSPFATGADGPVCMEAVNGYVYVNHAGGELVGHRLESDGSLVQIGTWQLGNQPNVDLVADAYGERLYAMSSNELWSFDIQADGSLLQTGAPADVVKVGRGIEVAPDGSHVYVSDVGVFGGGIGVSVYRVLADGSVEWTGKSFEASLPDVTSTSSNHPNDVVIAPDGNHLYFAVHTPIISAMSSDGGRVAAVDLRRSCCPTDVVGSPWSVESRALPKSLALSQDCSLLFLTTGRINTGGSFLYGFRVLGDGSLDPTGPGMELFPAGSGKFASGIVLL